MANGKIKTEIFEEYMQKHNLTKTAFCELCNISLSTFNKIMANDPNFRITALFKIAKVVKVEVYQMLKRD